MDQKSVLVRQPSCGEPHEQRQALPSQRMVFFRESSQDFARRALILPLLITGPYMQHMTWSM